MAARAASAARLSPVPKPMPMSAVPASCTMERTSAKSTFTSPWIVIRLAMPEIP